MRNIISSCQSCNPFNCGAVKAVGYAHSIEIYKRGARYFPVEMKNALRIVTQGKVWDQFHNGGWKLYINNPTRETIHMLEWHWRQDFSICALHVGYDFDFNDPAQRKLIVQLLDNHLHMRGQRTVDAGMIFHGEDGTTSRYSIDVKARIMQGKTRPPKIRTAYHDKHGKLDGECDKPRCEIRFEKGIAIKRLGIERPADILNIHPAELFRKTTTIRDHVEQMIRKARKTYTPTPYINIDTRIRAMMHRSEGGTLSQWKKRNERQFKKLQDRLDLFDIDPVLQLFPSTIAGCRFMSELNNVSQGN